jgi:hypothetical protein
MSYFTGATYRVMEEFNYEKTRTWYLRAENAEDAAVRFRIRKKKAGKSAGKLPVISHAG